MNIRSVIAGIGLMLASGIAQADGFNDGVVALLRGDTAQAVRVLQPLAEEGHIEAQYYMGYMHETGTGVDKNQRAAIRWYKLSAAQGHNGARVRAHVMMRSMTY